MMKKKYLTLIYLFTATTTLPPLHPLFSQLTPSTQVTQSNASTELSESTKNEYIIEFHGTDNQSLIKLLQDSSQIVALKKTPPKTEAALRRRAEADVAALVRALHTLAFYNAKVEANVDFSKTPTVVSFNIDTGPVYPLTSATILPEDLCISPSDLGFKLGKPAYPKSILDGEEALINLLARRGYPLAVIEKREILADQSTKSIAVTFEVIAGPLATFGETTIIGNDTVSEQYIRKKIAWVEGEKYAPCLIDQTVTNLELTRLFNSVNITYASEATENDTLPITIELSEAKQRSIGLGASISTQRGAGATALWDHRNLFHSGESLEFEADILQKLKKCHLSLTKPDFESQGQKIVGFTETVIDDTHSYNSSEFILGTYIERPLNDCTKLSYGMSYKYLRNTQSDNDGNYNLFMVPFTLKWASVDNFLDPSHGASFYCKVTPTLQFLSDEFSYTTTTFMGSVYYPFGRRHQFVLAGKANIGMIYGASRRDIPSSELFYAGSENTLRGYEYFTVGAGFDWKGKPRGGRSLMIYSVEGRYKLTETWGTVLFYDTGDVYATPYPQFDAKWLHSIGLGARYYTPVGPLRLDVAFPLTRRHKYDHPFQIYFSVGQAF